MTEIEATDSGQQTDVNAEVEGNEVVEPTTDDNVEAEPTPEGFKSLEEAAKAYEELKAGQPIVPADLKDYTYDTVEGIEIDEDAMAAAKEFAKENEIPAEYFKKFVAFDLARAKAFEDAAPEREKAALEEAKKEADAIIEGRIKKYGKGYDEAISFQQKAFSAYGLGDLVNDPSIANNDKLFDAMVQLGKDLSEGKINSGGVAPAQNVKLGMDGKAAFIYPSMEKK
jgi:hypothetical protein